MNRPSLVVLAAGQGTRLRPLTNRTPKAMVPILDVPLVDLALARGSSTGWAARFVNVSGPAPGLREHLRDRHPQVDVFEEGTEPIGQAATLRCLLPRLSDPVVTYNCDLVSGLELALLLRHHAGGAQDCTLAVQAVERGADLAAAEKRLRLVDRRVEDTGGYLFLGAACFNRSLVETIPAGQPLGLVAGLLRRAVYEDRVGLFEYHRYVCDAGTLGRYLEASLAALAWPEVQVHPPGVTSPDGWYLGPQAAAEPASLGAGAIVLAGAEVQAGAVLDRCIVWPGSVVPSGRRLSQGIWFEDGWLPA